MSLAFVPLYIKYLGIESYGLIGIFAVLQAWFTLLDLGMTPTLSREMARFTGGAHGTQSIRDLLRSIEIIGSGIACLIALGIWLASGWLASDWLRAEKLPVDVVTRAFTIMGIVTALRFIENIYRSSILGLQRHVLLNIVLGATGTLKGLGAVGILLWVSSTIDAFFIWQGFLSVITTGLFAFIVYRTLPESDKKTRFSFAALKGIRQFALDMLMITFFAILLTQVDKILLSRLLTLEAFSYYALAGTVANALYLLPSPVISSFYPRFTELVVRNDMKALITAYHKGAQLVTVIMGSAAVVLIAFSDIVMMLWTSNTDLSIHTAPLVAVLSLGTLLNGLLLIPYQLQLAYGWTSIGVKLNMLAVLIIVPAIFWASSTYGAIGAAWVWVVLNVCYLTIPIYILHRRLLPAEKWHWYFNDVGLPLFMSATVCIIGRLIIKPDWPFALLIVSLILVSGITILASACAANQLDIIARIKSFFSTAVPGAQ